MTVTYITAVISPRPGKEARVQELLESLVQSTETHEKDGALRYELTKAVDSTDFIVLETYASMEAVDVHKTQTYYVELGKTLVAEELVMKAPSIIASEKVCGFESR